MTFETVVSWWADKHLTTEDDYRVALDNFNVLFASNSNAIEGNSLNYHSTREVFEGNPITQTGFTSRELFEAQNQKFAADFIIKHLCRKTPITTEFVLKLHKILLYGCFDETRWRKGERPGEFKKNDYCVGTTGVGSYPDEVEEEIGDLLFELDCKSTDYLMIGAYFHAVFETIHPFADGNGRVGRTLLNYYLMSHNYPPLIVFSEDKEVYYMALEVYNRSEELSGLVQFLKEQTVKTWESRIRVPKSRQCPTVTCKTMSNDELLDRFGHLIQ